MNEASEGARPGQGPTRREVLKAGVAAAAGALLFGARQARANGKERGARIRTKPLRRQDLTPDPDLAG